MESLLVSTCRGESIFIMTLDNLHTHTYLAPSDLLILLINITSATNKFYIVMRFGIDLCYLKDVQSCWMMPN